MGYYTNYYLEIENENEIDPSIPEKVARILDDRYFGYEFDFSEMSNPLTVVAQESHKWYEHDTDMLDISRQFPTCKFVLEGEGEEPGDMWRKYYYNGHMQTAYAEITYEEPHWDEMED